jgi:hypothetical protein
MNWPPPPRLLSLGFQSVLLVASVIVVMGVVIHTPNSAAAPSAPSITITPAPAKGQFDDRETVQVSAGPNSLFVPRSRVVILECADPGGDPALLPLSMATCDENTIQGDTTVVQADGSFVEKGYALYALPSKLLGEQTNWQPVCNSTSECVLFVGENQNDFSRPKSFSHPFSISAAPGTAATDRSSATPVTPPVTPTVSVAGAPAVSAAVSLTPATLAFTGLGPWLWVVGAVGMVLLLVGLVGVPIVARGSRR